MQPIRDLIFFLIISVFIIIGTATFGTADEEYSEFTQFIILLIISSNICKFCYL